MTSQLLTRGEHPPPRRNISYQCDVPVVQVPLLLKLGEDERALQRAVESGDTDLVYLVLFSMHRSLPMADFVKAISARPRVRQLFLAYCAQVVRPCPPLSPPI